VLLIFLRVAAIVFSAPVLDTETIPVVFKAALAFAVSILLLPVVPTVVTVTNLSLTAFVMGMLSEIIIGVTIGLSVKLVFTGIQMAGQVAGYQMGLAVANVMDPSTMAQIPILAQLYNLTAMLIFLVINAHHMFFSALVESYRIIPPLSVVLSAQVDYTIGWQHVCGGRQCWRPAYCRAVGDHHCLGVGGPNRSSDEYLYCRHATQDCVGPCIHDDNGAISDRLFDRYVFLISNQLV
jgi:hypothetical protein